MKSGKSLIYIFTLSEEESASFGNMLRPLAKRYREYLSFVTVDAVEYLPMAKSMGLRAETFPGLVIQNPILGQIFVFDEMQAIKVDSVERFILDIVQGRKQPNTVSNERKEHTEL